MTWCKRRSYQQKCILIRGTGVSFCNLFLVHLLQTNLFHYGRGKILRVSLASLSAKNWALGKENLPRVLHSGKNCTRGREVFPSAAEILALSKDQHSAKALFPECNTRGRSALGKETCYLTVHSAHAAPECQNRVLGEEAAFPECQGRHPGKNFCFFKF